MKKKIFRKIIALLLLFALLFQHTGKTAYYALEGDNALYVKTLRVFRGTSLDDALKKCKAEGFQAVPSNLNDGNQGGVCVLGYETTDDPTDAITDVAALEMNNGYVMYDYDQILRQQMESVGTVSTPLMTSIAEYRLNLEAGSPAAEEARDILNLFYVPGAEDKLLGDALASEDCSEDLVRSILCQSNSGVTYTLFTALSVGVADYGTDDWATRLESINSGKNGEADEFEGFESSAEEEAEESSLEQLDRLYKASAKELKGVLQDFYAEYTEARTYVDSVGMNSLNEGLKKTGENEVPEETLLKITDSEELDLSETCAFSLIAYDILNQYAFDESTRLGDYILSLGALSYANESDYRQIYPLLAALTYGQFAVLRVTGVSQMAMSLINSNELTARAETELNAVKEDILQYTGDREALSVYAGTDQALVRGQVALTDDANRQTRAAGEYTQLTQVNSTDEWLDKILSAAFVTSSMVGIGVFLANLLVEGAIIYQVGFSAWLATSTCLWTICFNAALSVGSSILTSVLGFLGCVVVAMSYVILAVILLVLLVMFIKWIVDELSPEEDTLEYTEKDIPLEVYDYRDGTYLLYHAVRGNDNTLAADLNCTKGRRFSALFTTKCPSAGEPIRVSELSAPFVLTKNNTLAPAGYEGVHYFGSHTSANLNAYGSDSDASRLYLSFFRTEETDINPGEESEPEGDLRYISFLKVATEETESAAKDLLKKEGYTVVDYNLCTSFTGDSAYSYLGYKTTKEPSAAITDIRVAPAYTAEEYSYGYTNYVAAGTTACGTTIYFSKSGDMGSPIYEDLQVTNDRSRANFGFEPVNMFCGGPAYDLNEGSDADYQLTNKYYQDWNTCTFLYFHPSVTYTEGVEYLGGLAVFTGVNTSKKSGNELKDYMISSGWTPLDANLTKDYSASETVVTYAYATTYTANSVETYIGYSTTYNPKRAIYGIRSYTAPVGTIALSSAMGSYAGGNGGYAVCDVLFQLPQGNVHKTNEDFDWFVRGTSLRHSYLGISGIYPGACSGFKEPGMAPEDFENYSFGSSGLRMKGLYVTGYGKNTTPLTAEDIRVTTSLSEHEELLSSGFCSVQDLRTPNRTEAHNLAYGSSHPVYLYYRGTQAKKKYISSLYVASWDTAQYMTAQAINELEDDEREAMEKGSMQYCMNVLAATAGDEIVMKNLSVSYGASFEGGSEDIPTCSAYIGITRTDSMRDAIRSVIKFKPEAGERAETTIKVAGTTYTRAGDTAIRDGSGTYYLYYSTGEGSAPAEPITEIDFSDIPLVADSATALTATVTDIQEIRRGNEVVRAGRTAELKGYTNETNYIHLKYETEKTYISDLYVGAGSSRKAAMVDLLNMGCNTIIPIDLNQDADGQYVYLGYDRYAAENDSGATLAVRDILCTVGEEAAASITARGVTYKRACDRFIYSGTSGAVSLNEGTDGRKIYVYYTSQKTDTAEAPIMQLAATRCDYVPESSGRFIWECILTTAGLRVNANDGVYCSVDGHSYDNRIYLYANRETNARKSGAEVVGGTTESVMKYGKLTAE